MGKLALPPGKVQFNPARFVPWMQATAEIAVLLTRGEKFQFSPRPKAWTV